MDKEEKNIRMDARSKPDMPHIEQPGQGGSVDQWADHEPTSGSTSFNPLWNNYIQSRLEQFALR